MIEMLLYIVNRHVHKNIKSESSRIKSIIYPKATWGAFPQRRRPKDTGPQIYQQVHSIRSNWWKMMTMLPPVITKWLRQDLGILFFLSKLNSPASKDWWNDWYNYKHKLLVHPCIRHRTLFSVTLSREKPCPVGSSLCTAAPPLKTKNLSLPPIFRGGGVCTQAYINWLSFLLEQSLLLRSRLILGKFIR